MAVNPFSAGNFASWSSLVEWDGTNETDIRDWIRGLDPHNPTLESAQWQVSSLTPTQVVFTRPSTHPDGGPVTVTIPLGGWLSARVPGNGTFLGVQSVDKAGKWVTSDPYGRPANLNNLLP